MAMTDEELSTCRKIIHGHAVAAAAGNLVPVPGVGIATDTVTMTTMAMALAAALGGSITESVAKTMAVNAIISTIKRQPVRIIAKEVSKIVPIVGQLVAPSVSVAMLESAGWLLANELIEERDKKRAERAIPVEATVVELPQPNENIPALNDGHNFKYDKPFVTHEEAMKQSKSNVQSSNGGHNFKYEIPIKTHDD